MEDRDPHPAGRSGEAGPQSLPPRKTAAKRAHAATKSAAKLPAKKAREANALPAKRAAQEFLSREAPHRMDRPDAKARPIQSLTAEYLKRLSRFAACDARELASETALLKLVEKSTGRTPPVLVLLDSRGRQLDSGRDR